MQLTIDKELSTLVSARQKLESQQQENKSVQTVSAIPPTSRRTLTLTNHDLIRSLTSLMTMPKSINWLARYC